MFCVPESYTVFVSGKYARKPNQFERKTMIYRDVSGDFSVIS